MYKVDGDMISIEDPPEFLRCSGDIGNVKDFYIKKLLLHKQSGPNDSETQSSDVSLTTL